MFKNWKLMLGAGVAAVGGYFGYHYIKNTRTTVVALQPSGLPFQSGVGAAGVSQKVAIGLSDGRSTAYSFPIEALTNLSQIKGQNLIVAGKTIAALGGVLEPKQLSLPGA